MDIDDIIRIRRELIKINHTKDKTKKLKDILKIVIVIIILGGIGWVIFVVIQNVEEAINSSWNNLENVAKNQYLSPYGLSPDTQYREYFISSNGFRVYNDKDYNPDNTDLLEGSNYNEKILYTASNIVKGTFLMHNKGGKHVSKSYLENNGAYSDIAEYIHKHINLDVTNNIMPANKENYQAKEILEFK